jgi:hypothetical protein
MSAPAGPNKASSGAAQPRQGVNAWVPNASANQSLTVDADKFKTLQKYQKFFQKEQGTDICMKHHFRRFCYEGWPRIYKCRESGTDQAKENFHFETLKQDPNFAWGASTLVDPRRRPQYLGLDCSHASPPAKTAK